MCVQSFSLIKKRHIISSLDNALDDSLVSNFF